jgi:hypothetical protein
MIKAWTTTRTVSANPPSFRFCSVVVTRMASEAFEVAPPPFGPPL